MTSIRQAQDRTVRPERRSTTLRVVALIGIVLALLLPLGFVFGQFWSSTGDAVELTRAERRGVEYVQPVAGLLASLTAAQSAAVRAAPADGGAMRDAVADVDRVHEVHGATLGAEQRWSALRERVLALAESPASSDRPDSRYLEAVDLTVDLISEVGDAANLVLDPELDSYYLVDTVLLRLPVMIADAGRLADLAQLAGSDPAGPDGATLRAAVARDRLSRSADAVDIGLGKSFDATASDTLGPNLIGRLDSFRGAVDELAGSSSLFDPQPTSVDPDVVLAARDRFAQAAGDLGAAGYTELDALLRERESRIETQRIAGLVGVIVVGVGLALLLWIRWPGREAMADPADPDGDLADELPTEDGADGLIVRELVDARTMLDEGELARVGRAVRPVRRGYDDDPG